MPSTATPRPSQIVAKLVARRPSYGEVCPRSHKIGLDEPARRHRPLVPRTAAPTSGKRTRPVHAYISCPSRVAMGRCDPCCARRTIVDDSVRLSLLCGACGRGHGSFTHDTGSCATGVLGGSCSSWCQRQCPKSIYSCYEVSQYSGRSRVRRGV